MALKIGQVAMGFGVTPQTVRNWIKRPELQEFFGPTARRENNESQAELYQSDLEVCNSVQVLLHDHLDWNQIREKLASGWRDTNLPQKMAVVDDTSTGLANITLVAKLAAASSANEVQQQITQYLEKRVSDMEKRLDRSEAEREKNMNDLVEARVELKLWRNGKLKFDPTDTAG